jgi:hypothetical protein
MSLIINLAIQTLRYIPTQNIFRAPFGLPIVGKFSFGMPGYSSPVTLLNLNQPVIDLEPHSWYLVERIFSGGSIGAEDYFASIDASLIDYIPRIFLTKKLSGNIVNVKPVPIIQYYQNRESPIWVNSQTKKDQLLISCSGVLSQIPPTMGLAEIDLTIGFSIYQVSDAEHSRIMLESRK